MNHEPEKFCKNALTLKEITTKQVLIFQLGNDGERRQRGFQQMNELKSLHTQTRQDVAPHSSSVSVITCRIYS